MASSARWSKMLIVAVWIVILMYGSVRYHALPVDSGRLLFQGNRFDFAAVSDLDLNSRDPQEFIWRSYMRRATLIHVPLDEDMCRDNGAHSTTSKYRLELGPMLTLESFTAKQNRSMELSELVQFEDRLLAMCDYTGLVFKIDTAYPSEGSQPRVFQRWAIADGNGEKVKPCKIEWATVKDDLLFVGSIGVEWRGPDGGILHHDPKWVKTISSAGSVRNIDWSHVYSALKLAAGVNSQSGYLWHEAAHFCSRNRLWYFLPRKRALNCTYDPISDELMGTNILLIASEDFHTITVTQIGPLQPDRGFTSLRKIPGTDNHFLALKVREVDEETSTWITVFDSMGNMLLDPTDPDVDEDGFYLFDSDYKFEGLEFLNVA